MHCRRAMRAGGRARKGARARHPGARAMRIPFPPIRRSTPPCPERTASAERAGLSACRGPTPVSHSFGGTAGRAARRHAERQRLYGTARRPPDAPHPRAAGWAERVEPLNGRREGASSSGSSNNNSDKNSDTNSSTINGRSGASSSGTNNRNSKSDSSSNSNSNSTTNGRSARKSGANNRNNKSDSHSDDNSSTINGRSGASK